MRALSKSNPHSRFVPREEIDGVSAWKFSSMDGSEEEAPAETPAPEADPMDHVAVQEALDAAYQQGYAQGHETGTTETRAAMQDEIRRVTEATAARMGELMHNVTDQLLSSEQAIARQILDLACELARQVVRQELKTNTGHLRAVIGEALEMMIDDGLPAAVHMNPNDLVVMQQALLDTLGENAPEFIADPAISPGGCLVKSPSTTVDATIEKRWARAIGNLGLSASWQWEDSDV
ncbi:MAG TPA: FliH/SctL family protein [Hydrogenophaga sp.]